MSEQHPIGAEAASAALDALEDLNRMLRHDAADFEARIDRLNAEGWFEAFDWTDLWKANAATMPEGAADEGRRP